MNIAIVGSGISGLVCAYLLGQKYNVSLFEKAPTLGGHTCTHSFTLNNQTHHIDMGFIVFNNKTYPQFNRIIHLEKIPYQATEMSFSFKDEIQNFEYNGHTLFSLFGQKSNILNPKFYKMLKDILKFNRIAKRSCKYNRYDPPDLHTFIQGHQFGEYFTEAYLYPMAQAIWSSPYEDVQQFATQFIFEFYHNHGLLNIFNRPTWYVIQNGSKQYIPYLIKHLNDSQIYVDHEIKSIQRSKQGVEIHTSQKSFSFDKVIIATHSDQALNLLEKPSPLETDILSDIPYHQNDICLHTDSSLLPKNKACWASWNFRKNAQNQCQLTYYMNRLQSLGCKQDFFVSVNLTQEIAPEKIIKQINLSHPVLTHKTCKAQAKLPQLNNQQNTFFCGAYCRNGFHEDGVISALNACQQLGVSL